MSRRTAHLEKNYSTYSVNPSGDSHQMSFYTQEENDAYANSLTFMGTTKIIKYVKSGPNPWVSYI